MIDREAPAVVHFTALVVGWSGSAISGCGTSARIGRARPWSLRSGGVNHWRSAAALADPIAPDDGSVEGARGIVGGVSATVRPNRSSELFPLAGYARG